MSTQDFLVEIGTEELPPKALPKLIKALKNSLIQALRELQLDFGTVEEYASPRRLAVQIAELEDHVSSQVRFRQLRCTLGQLTICSHLVGDEAAQRSNSLRLIAQ